MAHFLRERIASKLCQYTPVWKGPAPHWPDLAAVVPWAIRVLPVTKQRTKIVDEKDSRFLTGAYPPHLVLDHYRLQAIWSPYRISNETIEFWADSAAQLVESDPLFSRISSENSRIEFEIDHKTFMKDCLDEIIQNKNYGFHSKLHQYFRGEKAKDFIPQKPNQTIVLDYSSPNIAKPFHAGHLRSTIQGHVMGNMFEKLGHQVHRINYLGNWGTQFGLLGVGFEKYGDKAGLEGDPLGYLLEIYVRMNEKAEKDPEVMEEARAFNHRLENGDLEALSIWRTFMRKSLEQYNILYKRLGIKFDVYDGEAQQVAGAKEVIKLLKEKNLLQRRNDLGYVFLEDEGRSPTEAPVVRKDGTTLYITRDVAAAMERYKKYKFDRMLYFVESGQQLHFRRLILLLQKLGCEWATGSGYDYHVRFGSVEGMSSRAGVSVLLQNILNRAQRLMYLNMLKFGTSKNTADPWKTADILARSGIIIQDLKQRRILGYKFTWKRMLTSHGDTGVSLQYAHAKLANIEKNCGFELDVNCDLDELVEPSAVNLVCHLARYDEVLNEVISTLDSIHLVSYLFRLSRICYVTTRELHVKDQPEEIAKPRLLLFHCARLVLHSGLETLGCPPLDEF